GPAGDARPLPRLTRLPAAGAREVRRPRRDPRSAGPGPAEEGVDARDASLDDARAPDLLRAGAPVSRLPGKGALSVARQDARVDGEALTLTRFSLKLDRCEFFCLDAHLEPSRGR